MRILIRIGSRNPHEIQHILFRIIFYIQLTKIILLHVHNTTRLQIAKHVQLCRKVSYQTSSSNSISLYFYVTQ